MKIMCVCRVYPTQRPGGMCFVAQDRAEELARRGYEVVVITTGLTVGQTREEVQTVNGVVVRHQPCAPQAYSREFADGCINECKSFRPDILHLDSFDRDRPWFQDRPGNPSEVVAITMHGTHVGAALTEWNRFQAGQGASTGLKFKDWRQEAIGLARADHVFAISEAEQWQLEDVYGLPNVHLVYNPIAPYFFEKEITAPPKDGYLLVAAISGSGVRQWPVAEKIAAAVGVPLRKAENIPRTEMPAVYDGCRLVLLPTLYAQGGDLAVCEAMARGRAVAGYATGTYYFGPRFDEGPFSDLYVVPRGHETELVKTVRQLLDRPPGKSRVICFRPEEHVGRWLLGMQL